MCRLPGQNTESRPVWFSAGLVSWLSAAISSKMQLHREPDGMREAHDDAADGAVKRYLSCRCTPLRILLHREKAHFN